MTDPAALLFADDAQLLTALREGDERAHEYLVRRHGGRMLATARRILKNETDADDALQDAFISALRGLGSFEGQSQLGTWLHRIVVNAALMRLRRRKPEREQSIEDLLPDFLESGSFATNPEAWPEDAQQLLERDEIRTLIRAKIDELPDGYRNVLLLRDIEEMTGAETAEQLGITSNAVKVRLHRARQALRELLAPHLLEADS